MRSQKLNVTNRHGQHLAAQLDMPVNGEPQAFGLLIHCFACSENGDAAENISRALTEDRIAVLRLDLTRLTDDNGTVAGAPLSSPVDDLVDAAAFLKHQYQSPRLLIGHSLGGAAVLQAAPQIASATAVVTIGAPAHSGRLTHLLASQRNESQQTDHPVITIRGRSFSIQRQFLDNLAEAQMKATIQNLQKALLLCHSPLDRIVGIANAREIYLAAKHPKSFLSLDQADHLLSAEEDSRYAAGMIVAWARKYIGTFGFNDREFIISDEAGVTACTGTEHYRTDIIAGRHGLVADEPEQMGGRDAGPTPYDLLLAALGSCTTITLRMYADRKGWPLHRAIVRLDHTKIHARDCAHCESSDAVIDRIQRSVEFVGPLSAEQRHRLLEIADKCPVHKTLHSEISVATTEFVNQRTV